MRGGGANIIYGKDELLVPWAQERIPHNRFRSDAKAIGIEINHKLRAVTVWDNFSPRSCLISVASDGNPNWMTREFGVHSMAYPFVQCGFTRLTSLVAANNEPSLKFVQRFGFTYEGTLREASFDGANLIVFGMLRRECLWLRPEQRVPSLLDMAIAV